MRTTDVRPLTGLVAWRFVVASDECATPNTIITVYACTANSSRVGPDDLGVVSTGLPILTCVACAVVVLLLGEPGEKSIGGGPAYASSTLEDVFTIWTMGIDFLAISHPLLGIALGVSCHRTVPG